MKTTPNPILERARRAQIAVAIAIMALLGLVATSHADPGTPSARPADISIIQVKNYGPQVTAPMNGGDKIAKMRQRLNAELIVQIKGATLDELVQIEVGNTETARIVQAEMAARVSGSPTEKLCTIFKEQASPQLRLAIAKEIEQRTTEVTTESLLQLAMAIGDDAAYLDTSILLAHLAKQKLMTTTDPQKTINSEALAALISGQPFYMKQALLDALIQRGDAVETKTLVSAFVGLGQFASSRPDLFDKIMERTDRTIETTALMLAALDIGKG